MKHNHRFLPIVLSVLLTLIISSLGTISVLADDEPPATPIPTEAASATPESAATETATETPPAEETTGNGIVTEVPQGSDVVVLDQNNVPAPLATQSAATAISTSDPMWCPAGQIPGDAGCTASYATVTDLIANIGTSSGEGTIYFTSTYSTNDAVFDSSTLTNLNALTIQGGWNGQTGGRYGLSGVTTFSVPVTINWDNATVTINDIIVDGANGTGLSVTSTGDINLNNVQVTNSSNGAQIDNSGGTGRVRVQKTVLNKNGGNGLAVNSCGAITLSDIASNNNGIGASITNNCGVNNGAPGIDISGSNSFNGNNSLGLFVQSRGDINLQNISVNNNGDIGAFIDNCILQPNGQFCDGIGHVSLTGSNVFSNNKGNNLAGLNIVSNGAITINNTFANGNAGDGIYLEMGQPSTINASCIAGNRGYGIESYGGALILNGVVLSNNTAGSVHLFNGSLIQNGGSNHCGEGDGIAKASASILPIHIVNVAEGQTVALDCETYRGTLLILPNGDSAYFPCPIGGTASLRRVEKNNLPGALPNGFTFVSAFNPSIDDSGQLIQKANESITISFVIPQSMEKENLAIMYWNGSQWVELTNGLDLGAGRRASSVGRVNDNGAYFRAQINFTGKFTLVGK